MCLVKVRETAVRTDQHGQPRVAMAPPSHHSHTGRAAAGLPVQDWETPGLAPLPEVSLLLWATIIIILQNALSQPFSQQRSEVGSGDLYLHFRRRKPRLRMVR